MGIHYGSRLLGNARVPAIATGGTETVIEQNGLYYRVHSFTTVGTSSLEVTRGGEVEYLIVAGGGPGGSGVDRTSGAGGAGGVIMGNISVVSNSYSIVVGDGGSSPNNTNGENSLAFSLTAFGGGAGGRRTSEGPYINGVTGGSGGAGQHNALSAPGTGIQGQGNSGGNGYDSGVTTRVFSSGGGGGAGTQGGNASTVSAGSAGQGGAGVPSAIQTGVDLFYGGGGGGSAQFGTNWTNYQRGAGGLGGGGDGARSQVVGSIQLSATNGLVNTGGGGGGGAAPDVVALTGGDGGSGIVIIRYRITQAEYDASL